MSNPLEEFIQKKENERAEYKKQRSIITLEYYDLIEEMLEDEVYTDSYNYLYSVQQFIEESEFITDKQIEVINQIRDNRGEDSRKFRIY